MTTSPAVTTWLSDRINALEVRLNVLERSLVSSDEARIEAAVKARVDEAVKAALKAERASLQRKGLEAAQSHSAEIAGKERDQITKLLGDMVATIATAEVIPDAPSDAHAAMAWVLERAIEAVQARRFD